MSTQTLSYAALTTASGNPLKRFSHGRRFETALQLVAPRDGDAILDYGTGDGHFLGLLKARAPGARIAGHDPFPDAAIVDVLARHPDLEFSADIGHFAGRRFTKVCCFETLEHFEGEHARRHVRRLAELTAPGGLVHVSVPIEIGPAALVKNLVRAATGRPHPSASLRNILSTALYRPAAVERIQEDAGGYIQSHIGFDYRTIPALFAEAGLGLRQQTFSPLGTAGGSLNSQAFFVFGRE